MMMTFAQSLYVFGAVWGWSCAVLAIKALRV